MMGISAIITGVFLFSYTAARSPTADLAFTCISGLWGNFGESTPLPQAIEPARDLDKGGISFQGLTHFFP